MKNRSVFYSHAGAGNHGCEAIVRSSSQILDRKPVLYSVNPEQDEHYDLRDVVERIEIDKDVQPKRYSVPWLRSRLQTKFTGNIDLEIYYRKQSMMDSVQPGDIWYSIGGDNYCYPGTEILASENELIKKRGAKTVLWGCSVEPELLKQDQIAKDLANYDLITARESISYNALREINPNTVLVSDPAFTLKKIELPLPDGWKIGNMIGINASPLIQQNSKSGELVLIAYKNLIEEILHHTDCGIALIPHVVWGNNDDRIPLRELYDQYATSGRIMMIGDCNCMELKGYIARCRMFIGARTHATIAAYSSCVPTLVLGYSVKSKGIAVDLFGTDKDYVLPVQSLSSEDDLVHAFQWLMGNERKIKNQLESIMPEYMKRAYRGKTASDLL